MGGAHLPDEVLRELSHRQGVAGVQRGKPLLEQPADAVTDHGVRHQTPFDPADGECDVLRHDCSSGRARRSSCRRHLYAAGWILDEADEARGRK